MTEGTTIVERLQSQRTLLVDVLHQLEAAIKVFGGTISPNGNGVIIAGGKGSGRGGWQKVASPAKLRRWQRNMAAARKANRERAREAVLGADYVGRN